MAKINPAPSSQTSDGTFPAPLSKQQTHISFFAKPGRSKARASLFSAIDAVDLGEKKENFIIKFFKTFTFHPNGKFHMVWDSVLLMCVLFSCFYEPYSVSFYIEDTSKLWLEEVVDALFWIDMIVNFWTAYDTGYRLVTDKKEIAFLYLRGWFSIDFLSTLDLDLYIKNGYGDTLTAHEGNLISLLRLLKIARVFRLSRFFGTLTRGLTTNSTYLEAMKFFIYVILAAHMLGCFFFLVPYLAGEWNEGSWRDHWAINDQPIAEQYINSLYWSFTTMTTIGYGQFFPKTHAETVYVINAELVGLAVFALLLTRIQETNDAMAHTVLKNNAIKDEIIGFIQNSGIEKEKQEELLDKVREFLRFRSKSNYHTFENNDERFECLSYALKDEIRTLIFLPALRRIDMFEDKEEAALDELLEMLDSDDVKGFIDEEEFMQLSEDSNLNMSEEDVKNTMKEMGLTADGMVTIDSFKKWYHFHKYGVPQLPFPPACITMLASRLRVTAFSPSDKIVNKGSYGMNMFLVLTGVVHVHKREYKDMRLGVLFKAKAAARKLKNYRMLHKMNTGEGGNFLTRAVAAAEKNPEKEMSVPDTPRDEQKDGNKKKDKPGLGKPGLGEQMEGLGLAGEENSIMQIKDSDRYPVFGLIAGLTEKYYTTMRDRTRRWEVKVNSKEIKGKTGCADVAYVDRFQLLQVLEATWDGKTRAEKGTRYLLEFVRSHYNIPSLGKADEHLQLHTTDYMQRVKVTKLSKELNKALQSSTTALPESASIDDVRSDIMSMAQTFATSTKLAEQRLEHVQGMISTVQAACAGQVISQ